jgi:hypothetical protein
VDDEKNVSSLATYNRRSFRQLQSYDVRTGCLRTYEPSSGSSSGTWWLATVQRFPDADAMGPPPVRRALSAAEVLLWDVANCLGASSPPDYNTTHYAGGSRVTVRISVPKTEASGKHYDWSFTQCQPSAREAKQAAAHEAATFLRSRFRSVLDGSPWSFIPYYHSHVDEEEEEEDEDHSDSPSGLNQLFGYTTRWYGGY